MAIFNCRTGQLLIRAPAKSLARPVLQSSVSPTSLVNPYDVFTATAKAQKIFSDGIVDVGASMRGRIMKIQALAGFHQQDIFGRWLILARTCPLCLFDGIIQHSCH